MRQAACARLWRGERHPEAGATADRFRHINPAVQRLDPTQAPILAT
jgi:hypothetical protein